MDESKPYSRHHKGSLLVLIFLISISNLGQMTLAENLSPSTHSLAEQWVLKQVITGNEADLKKQFQDKKDWVLSASFLERLLEGSFGETKLHRHGVQIKNAIFNNPIDLANAQVPHETRLIGCLFEKEVNLSNSIFNKDFYLDGSTFSFKANFRAMKVGGTFSFEKTIFRNEADFREVEVLHSFEASGAEFRNRHQKVGFSNIKVGKNVIIMKTKFSGPLSFAAAVIHGGLNASNAEFENTEEEVNFKNMKIGSGALFFGAKFSGPVSFLTTNIGGSFLAIGAEFRNKTKPAEFDLFKVGGLAHFSEAKFSGPVTFISAAVAGDFDGNLAEFRNGNQEADFNSFKVGGHVFFKEAKFSGPVNFASMNITGNFKADETNFKGNTTFSGMQVGGRASFIETAFAGDLVMKDAKFLHLSIQGPKEKVKTNSIPLLDLSRAEIKGGLQIQDLIVQRMMATSIKVLGPTVLRNLTIEDELSLEYSTFLNVSLLDVSRPKSEKSMRINGMTYQYISAGDKKDSWKHLLELVNGSSYDANNYTNLEAFFRRQGYPSQADEVFIEHKRQERKKFLSGIRWFWSFLLEYFVGHGRKPERALLWGGFFIMMGYFIFRRKEGMELRRREETSPHYNAMWYSLDLFIPLVRLQVADLWMPRRDRWFARNYAHFHKILGNIMIPFGIAAVTGIIK